MRAFKDELRQIIREMNMQWGAMAKKMGTMTEDLVAPSIPRDLSLPSKRYCFLAGESLENAVLLSSYP